MKANCVQCYVERFGNSFSIELELASAFQLPLWLASPVANDKKCPIFAIEIWMTQTRSSDFDSCFTIAADLEQAIDSLRPEG